MSKKPKYIVVIGASAGGLDALCEMFTSFKTGLDTAYCVVLHLSRKGIGDFVAHRISQVTSMPCRLATNEIIHQLMDAIGFLQALNLK